MRDRATELEHLLEAVRHVAEAENAIARLEELIAHQRDLGAQTQEAEKLLHVMSGMLEAMRSHRETIQQTIDDIDAGRL